MPELTLCYGEVLPEQPFHPTHTGAWMGTVMVRGKQRHYIAYIPADVRASTSGVLVIPGNGVSAQELYEGSNWTMLADTDERKEKFIVFFLESSPDGWNLEDPKEDLEYIYQVYLDAGRRNRFCVHESKFYLTGYKEGGALAQMAAMDNPAVYAGVVSVDAPAVDKEFINKTGGSYAVDLNGFEDPEAKHKIRKKDLCVPVWMISSDTVEEMANSPEGVYWRECAGTALQPRLLRPDVTEYYREEDAPWTVNQEKEAFHVWFSQKNNASGNCCNRMNRRIWAEFLRKVVRMMGEPGGDLRAAKDPVWDLGMEYYYEAVDGWMREYYLYVPKNVRNNIHKKVPLVFAMHGYTCSGEIYINNSQWYKVAEANDFIVVFPSATHGYLKFDGEGNKAAKPENTALPSWNLFDEVSPAPNELKFFEHMLEQISRKYAVDRQRIYATGHSQGSLMTQLLGMLRPDIFAAIAPCSGVLFLNAGERFPHRSDFTSCTEFDMPVWMFGGEREEWLFPAVPRKGNMTADSICFWQNRNRMEEEKQDDFESVRTLVNDRWNDYIWYKNEIPMVRYTWVEYLPHATMTEMSFRIWNEFFSKIRREENGSICYQKDDEMKGK